jgi:hypothetical protein
MMGSRRLTPPNIPVFHYSNVPIFHRTSPLNRPFSSPSQRPRNSVMNQRISITEVTQATESRQSSISKAHSSPPDSDLSSVACRVSLFPLVLMIVPQAMGRQGCR